MKKIRIGLLIVLVAVVLFGIYQVRRNKLLFPESESITVYSIENGITDDTGECSSIIAELKGRRTLNRHAAAQEGDLEIKVSVQSKKDNSEEFYYIHRTQDGEVFVYQSADDWTIYKVSNPEILKNL